MQKNNGRFGAQTATESRYDASNKKHANIVC